MKQEIKPTYVSFEQAKALEKKGFNFRCNYNYFIHTKELTDKAVLTKSSENAYISAPEQWQVVEWLRVNHGIEIETKKDRTVKWSNNYYNHAIFKNDVLIHQRQLGGTQPNSPQKAYSAAFDYILTKLI